MQQDRNREGDHEYIPQESEKHPGLQAFGSQMSPVRPKNQGTNSKLKFYTKFHEVILHNFGRQKKNTRLNKIFLRAYDKITRFSTNVDSTSGLKSCATFPSPTRQKHMSDSMKTRDINLQDSRGVGYQFLTCLLSLPPKTRRKVKSMSNTKLKDQSQIHLS